MRVFRHIGDKRMASKGSRSWGSAVYDEILDAFSIARQIDFNGVDMSVLIGGARRRDWAASGSAKYIGLRARRSVGIGADDLDRI
jgi:hypothetical protein